VDAHFLQRLLHFGAAAQRRADLGEGHPADHHAPADQALAQARFDRVGLRAIAEQLDQHW